MKKVSFKKIIIGAVVLLVGIPFTIGMVQGIYKGVAGTDSQSEEEQGKKEDKEVEEQVKLDVKKEIDNKKQSFIEKKEEPVTEEVKKKTTINTQSFKLEKLKNGELLDVKDMGDTLIIKAKIEPSMTNKLTIAQNGHNVEDIIKNHNGDKFTEIQYWAVADMESGEESKVISFTLSADQIKQVKEGKLAGGSYLVEASKDCWILPSLKR